MTPAEITGYYGEHPRHYVSVDCVIFGICDGRLNILLIRRRMMPGKDKWSLMGGFVGEGESLDSAAKRILHQLTGLSDVYMEQVGAFGSIDRDPGARVISVAYCALINFDEHDRKRAEENCARWVPLEEMPQLFFDHPQMVEKALGWLRRKFGSEPICFNLLPEFFTLTQLQSLYESVLGEAIDKRNFRKRVAETDCIEKTDMIDKNSSRRGAVLYRFNPGRYRESKNFRL